MIGHLRDRLKRGDDRAVALAHDDVHGTELRISGRVVVSRMSASTLLAVYGGSRHAFRDGEQRAQVQGRMPAGMVRTAALDANLREPLPVRLEMRQRLL